MKAVTGEEEKSKPIVVSVFADSMVKTDVIRMSPEDIARLGALEGDTVIIKRKIPFTEVIGIKAGNTGKTIKEETSKAGATIEKGMKEIGEKIMPGKKEDEL
ncbi:hypothetical protein [Methanochimaera problematica]|nr:hypothetical protein [Methanoplanus sp. FWC-SCC4]